jgi:tetratricopeptide (TPR) repeat protein
LLDGDYAVSLLKDNRKQTIQIGRRKATDLPTGWPDTLDPKGFEAYLSKYRTHPQSCAPDQAVQKALHAFLFAGSTLDGPAQTLGGDSEVLISSDVVPVLTNIPWELAYGPPKVALPNENPSCFDSTFASLPVARVWSESSTTFLDKAQERLRILYCVTEPANAKFGAERFLEVIDRVLMERSGMLDRDGVVTPQFQTRYDQFEAALKTSRPHIVVIACHGQTKSGSPELLFEQWIPVPRIAAAIASQRRTFLVVLIACNQVLTENRPAAESGALAIIRAGIPAAVAMQSSVRADLAAEFLGGMLDGLFRLGVARAVAQGRKRMAPDKSSCRHVEWSFPALFFSSDGQAQTANLSEWLKGYVPALEAMMRTIPARPDYFPRQEVDARLKTWLDHSEPGLRALEGPRLAGKSTTVRQACREAIKAAVLTSNLGMRPILYLDMDGRPVEDGDALSALLRNRMDEATAPFAPRLFPIIPPPRGADGANTNFGLAQLLGFLDANGILILDNFDAHAALWQDFLTRAKSLVHLTVVAIVEDASSFDLPAPCKITLTPLNEQQTQEFLQRLHPVKQDQAAQLFAFTGGLPGLLHLVVSPGLRIPAQKISVPSVIAQYTKILVDQLPTEERSVLLQMVFLPNGLSFALASNFLSDWNTADITHLVWRGLLTTDYRQEIRWFRLSGWVREGLLLLAQNEIDAAKQALAQSFRDYIAADNDEQVVENLCRVVAGVGGRDFIQDMHVLFASIGATDDLRNVALLINEWLYSHSFWGDAYRLWKRVVDSVPPDETVVDDWIMLANAAHKIGRPREASHALGNANRHSPDAFEAIRMKLLYTTILKDMGAIHHAAMVTRLYESALRSIDAALETAGDDLHWFAFQKAIATYNRSLHRRYWLRDIPGALADLEDAGRQFNALADAQMMAMADCEWAEIQLTVSADNKDWDKILEKLVRADDALKLQEVPSDRAFCNYQLARYYRRKPDIGVSQRRSNLENARQAYAISMEQSSLADDLRQQLIAEAAFVEVSYFGLGAMPIEDARSRLERIARSLENFRGDAWSTRVLRDICLWRSQIDEPRAALLKKALSVATSKPLTPERGTDASRAAWILYQYLALLAVEQNTLERQTIAVIYAPLLRHWLGNQIDPSNPDGWIEQLRGLGHAPGGYDG